MATGLRFSVIATLAGCAAAIFTVDAVGVKAESPLEFLTKQFDKQRPSYERRPVQVERGRQVFGGFFDDLFGERTLPPPKRSAGTASLERVVCRRTCDGAELALGIVPARRTHAEATAMCAAAGRGAKTELVVRKFVPGEGFEAPATVQTASAPPLQEGRAALTPDSRPPASESCASARQVFMTVPILHDSTLRNGDIVATSDGFKVFVGRGKPPYKDSDFVDASTRKRVASELRKLKTADR